MLESVFPNVFPRCSLYLGYAVCTYVVRKRVLTCHVPAFVLNLCRLVWRCLIAYNPYCVYQFFFCRCIAQSAACVYLFCFEARKLPLMRVFSLLVLGLHNSIVYWVSTFCAVPSLFAQVSTYISDAPRWWDCPRFVFALRNVPGRSLHRITGS